MNRLNSKFGYDVNFYRDWLIIPKNFTYICKRESITKTKVET